MLNFVALHDKFDPFITRIVKQQQRLVGVSQGAQGTRGKTLAKTYSDSVFQFSLALTKTNKKDGDSCKITVAK